MTTNVDSTPAKRFINAYNQIDHALRAQYNFKNNISFTDLVRRCSSLNSIIKTHEDDLISFARLRNAIVHAVGDYIVAEPHETVVKAMESIVELITTPPLALEALGRRKVAVISSCSTLAEWLVEKNRVGYSNLPVYKGNMLIGLMHWRQYFSGLGKVVLERRSVDQYLQCTTVEEFLQENPSRDELYKLVSERVTIEEMLRLFDVNRKLVCVIITKAGKAMESPLRIVTRVDIMDLMKVLESF